MDAKKHWLKVSESLFWRTKPCLAQTGSWPRVTWYKDGILNLSESCLDRHVLGGSSRTVAVVELLEDGRRREITYGKLLAKTNRYANLLVREGVRKGDAVIIYMPAVIETAAAMLACARIGAVHSVVFAGLSTEALGERAHSLRARAILTADVTFRRGKEIDLVSNVRAVATGEKVFVLKRKKGTTLRKGEIDLEAKTRRENNSFVGGRQ
jgi:acetyl-CoA synthetase